MTDFVKGARFRAAIGLIAAYAIALQTLFAAFAPLPAHAQASDVAGWSVLCFGSGNAVPADGDPAAPASGTFHCVLCGSALAAAAVLPEPGKMPQRRIVRSAELSLLATPAPVPTRWSFDGPARAPPLSV